tara:strand:+ start:6203 stop:6835 length:633 start_codon:yes stop_codon:yes gene_type:complete
MDENCQTKCSDFTNGNAFQKYQFLRRNGCRELNNKECTEKNLFVSFTPIGRGKYNDSYHGLSNRFKFFHTPSYILKSEKGCGLVVEAVRKLYPTNRIQVNFEGDTCQLSIEDDAHKKKREELQRRRDTSNHLEPQIDETTYLKNCTKKLVTLIFESITPPKEKTLLYTVDDKTCKIFLVPCEGCVYTDTQRPTKYSDLAEDLLAHIQSFN